MLDFLSGIGNFLGGVASAIGAAVAYLLSTMLQLFSLVIQLLSIVAQFFATLLHAVGAFFAHLWQNFFKGILSSIWQHVRDAVAWLHSHLVPLVKWLQKVRDRLDRWFRMYVQPYLRMIQRIRGYLHVLALLHVKFAAELDAKLAQVQAEITRAFATVRGTLNTLIDIANAIQDPNYLARKPWLLLSIRRQLPALVRAITGRAPGYWFPSPRGSAGGPFKPFAPFAANGDANPIPATSSYIAADDGLGDYMAGFDGAQLTANAADAAAPLDWFDNDLWPAPAASSMARAMGYNDDGTPVKWS